MTKPSASEVRLRRENAALRKANHQLTVERQGYALRAKLVELDFADWKKRLDKLLALAVPPVERGETS